MKETLRVLLSTGGQMMELSPESWSLLSPDDTSKVFPEVKQATASSTPPPRSHRRHQTDAERPVASPPAAGGRRRHPSPWPVLQLLLKNSTSAMPACKSYPAFAKLEILGIGAEGRGPGPHQALAPERPGGPRRPEAVRAVRPGTGPGFELLSWPSKICSKRLDSLALEIEWMGLPDGVTMKQYYQDYKDIIVPTPPENAFDFKVTRTLHDGFESPFLLYPTFSRRRRPTSARAGRPGHRRRQGARGGRPVAGARQSPRGRSWTGAGTGNWS